MKVEIWSDVVCPWCYIGKRRFESALAQFAHRDDVEVEWRSFELDPSTESVSAAGEGPGARRADRDEVRHAAGPGRGSRRLGDPGRRG